MIYILLFLILYGFIIVTCVKSVPITLIDIVEKWIVSLYDFLITECAMEYTGPVGELKEMCEKRIEVAGMH